MLDSLEIHNYRNLKELRINSLGRVNLITGKNNTGKSTLLEALAIYSSKGNTNLIYQLLGERGENYPNTTIGKNIIEYNIKALSSLFTNRIIGFDNENTIIIGPISNILLGEQQSTDNSIVIRFVKYYEKQPVFSNNSEKELDLYKVGLEIEAENHTSFLPLDEDKPHRYPFRGLNEKENFQFIRTRNIDREINGKLFDIIALTDKEKFVIEALKIIEASTERIAFIEENPGERTAVIKLTNNTNILPLQSMGDGINRILTIILALVNSDNGYLLIDEFENGLHHTVQEQLWKVIFDLSQKLNVQVFVTTHSEDCIVGFENVLNNQSTTVDGKLIRLDNINGVIRQVEFTASELKIATDQNIEMR